MMPRRNRAQFIGHYSTPEGQKWAIREEVEVMLGFCAF
jgi:hypothetical protein